MISGEYSTNSGPQKGKSPAGDTLVKSLAVMIGFETLLVWAGAIYFLSQMFMQEVNDVAGAVVIFAITVLIAIGLTIVTVATWRSRSWTRGAIVTWQILQFAVATSFIQGISQWQPAGWVLAVLALIVVVLLFTPVVTKQMTKGS